MSSTPSTTGHRLLRVALVVFGAVMLLLYPLAVVWPSGWAWHHGAPYESDYFMMIVGLYAVLGAFLGNAARRPESNVSLIWFTVWSSVVHAVIMAVLVKSADLENPSGYSFDAASSSRSQTVASRPIAPAAGTSTGAAPLIAAATASAFPAPDTTSQTSRER